MILDRTSRLRVSDRARSRILGIMDDNSTRKDGKTRVRVFAEERPADRRIELALALDEKRPGDVALDDDALALVTDGESMRVLDGLVLDYEESAAFHGFTLCRERARTCAHPGFAE